MNINGSSVGINVLKQNTNDEYMFDLTNSAFVKNTKNNINNAKIIIKFFIFVIIALSSS